MCNVHIYYICICIRPNVLCFTENASCGRYFKTHNDFIIVIIFTECALNCYFFMYTRGMKCHILQTVLLLHFHLIINVNIYVYIVWICDMRWTLCGFHMSVNFVLRHRQCRQKRVKMYLKAIMHWIFWRVLCAFSCKHGWFLCLNFELKISFARQFWRFDKYWKFISFFLCTEERKKKHLNRPRSVHSLPFSNQIANNETNCIFHLKRE